MTFKDAVLPWFDSDRLMSRRPNPGIGEEGNPVLETGNAYFFLNALGEMTTEDITTYFDSIKAFEHAVGLPNKKPRSQDMVTHDDLIGYVAGSVALNGCPFHYELYHYGETHGWQLTNNNDKTWESLAKPWHIAFYCLAANQQPGFFRKLLLAASIIIDAYTGMDNASNKRLTYLMIKTISGRSRIIDLAASVWWRRIRRVYGGAKRIYIMLKGEQHPFSLYCPD